MTSSWTTYGLNKTFKKKLVWSQGWYRNTSLFSIQDHLVPPWHTSALLTRVYTCYCIHTLTWTEPQTHWIPVLYPAQTAPDLLLCLCTVTMQNRKKYSKRETKFAMWDSQKLILSWVHVHIYARMCIIHMCIQHYRGRINPRIAYPQPWNSW